MTCLVFGSAGHIGRSVCVLLESEGVDIIWAVKDNLQKDKILADHNDRNVQIVDVTNRDQLENLSANLADKVSSILYAVGHGPAGGFDEVTKYPLSKLPQSFIADELSIHVIGLLNVFQILLPHIADSGSVTILSSAITDVPQRELPDSIYVGHYAAAIAAKNELVKEMRRDPFVAKHKIKINRLALESVDTPFHTAGYRKSKLLALELVSEKITRTVKGAFEVDQLVDSSNIDT